MRIRPGSISLLDQELAHPLRPTPQDKIYRSNRYLAIIQKGHSLMLRVNFEAHESKLHSLALLHNCGENSHWLLQLQGGGAAE
jgi:hypothetical protein